MTSRIVPVAASEHCQYCGAKIVGLSLSSKEHAEQKARFNRLAHEQECSKAKPAH